MVFFFGLHKWLCHNWDSNSNHHCRVSKTYPLRAFDHGGPWNVKTLKMLWTSISYLLIRITPVRTWNSTLLLGNLTCIYTLIKRTIYLHISLELVSFITVNARELWSCRGLPTYVRPRASRDNHGGSALQYQLIAFSSRSPIKL